MNENENQIKRFNRIHRHEEIKKELLEKLLEELKPITVKIMNELNIPIRKNMAKDGSINITFQLKAPFSAKCELTPHEKCNQYNSDQIFYSNTTITIDTFCEEFLLDKVIDKKYVDLKKRAPIIFSLSDEFHESNLEIYAKSIIVHELVHHYQVLDKEIRESEFVNPFYEIRYSQPYEFDAVGVEAYYFYKNFDIKTFNCLKEENKEPKDFKHALIKKFVESNNINFDKLYQNYCDKSWKKHIKYKLK